MISSAGQCPAIAALLYSSTESRQRSTQVLVAIGAHRGRLRCLAFLESTGGTSIAAAPNDYAILARV